MKRVVLAVFITVAAIILGIFTGGFIENKVLVLEEDFNACYELLKKENIKHAEEKLDDILNYWDENKMSVGLFINGEICENLEDEIRKLKLLIKSGNTDSALESIGECLNILTSVKEKEKLNIESVL